MTITQEYYMKAKTYRSYVLYQRTSAIHSDSSSADFHHKKSLEPDNSLRLSRYLSVSHQHWEHHFRTSKPLRSKVANIPLRMFESKWSNFSFYFWVPRPTHVPFPIETQHSRGISNLIMRDWIKTHNDKVLYETILTILRSQTTALVVIQLKKEIFG